MTYSDASDYCQVNSRGHRVTSDRPRVDYCPEKQPLADEISARMHAFLLDSGLLSGLGDDQLDDLDARLDATLSGIKRLCLKEDGTPYKPLKKRQKKARNA